MRLKIARIDKGDIGTGALTAGAGAFAMAPMASDEAGRRRQVKIDPTSKKLVIVTEGGRYHTGGAGHSAAAKAIETEAVGRLGRKNVSVVNHNDLQVLKSDGYTKGMRGLARRAADPASKNKKLWWGLYGAGQLPMRPQSQKATRKAFEGAGRVIATQPDSVNFLKGVGIRPELVVTDYDVSHGSSKQFWNLAYGNKGYDANDKRIGRAYVPSKASDGVFSSHGTPVKRIGSIPVDSKFFTPPKVPLQSLSINSDGGKFVRDQAIPQGKKLIVVTGGSTGGDVDRIVESLAQSGRKDIHIVGIAGKNKEVLAKLQAMEARGLPVTAQGFEKQYAQLLHRADVVFARPHGLSATEALATGRPVVPVVTDMKRGKLTDAWAQHMPGNAKHYSKVQGGAPIAHIFEDGARNHKSIAGSLDDVLTNHGRYAAGSKQYAKQIQGAAGQILDAPNATKSVARKLPKVLRRGALLGAGVLGAGAAYATYKGYKNSKTASAGDLRRRISEVGSGVAAPVAATGAGVYGLGRMGNVEMSPAFSKRMSDFGTLHARTTADTFVPNYAAEAHQALNEPIISGRKWTHGKSTKYFGNIVSRAKHGKPMPSWLQNHYSEIVKSPVDGWVQIADETVPDAPWQKKFVSRGLDDSATSRIAAEKWVVEQARARGHAGDMASIRSLPVPEQVKILEGVSSTPGGKAMNRRLGAAMQRFPKTYAGQTEAAAKGLSKIKSVSKGLRGLGIGMLGAGALAYGGHKYMNRPERPQAAPQIKRASMSGIPRAALAMPSGAATNVPLPPRKPVHNRRSTKAPPKKLTETKIKAMV